MIQASPDAAGRGRALHATVRRLIPGACILLGLALLTVYAFGDALRPRIDRLPGRDAPIFYAWEVYTRAAFDAGAWPHWNPYFWSGTLHFADTLTTAIYPPAVLLRWLEPASFLRWMAVLHVLISGAGALFLARVLGLGWLSAAAAALALTIGGAAGASLNSGHLVIMYCVAWLPWIMALGMISVRRGRILPHPMLPIVLVVQFLAGYLQGSLYTLGALCLYYLFSVAWPDRDAPAAPRWRPLGQLAVLGALTLGLSAVQTFPFTQLALETARTQGLSWERASAGAWSFSELATFVWPFGNWVSHRIAYVGWLLVCVAPLALAGRAHRRIVVFLVLLALGTVALALGDNLPFYRWHYTLFPGLRLPARILFVTTLCAAIIGAIGLERFVALARERRWRVLTLGAAAAAVLVAAASLGALEIARSDDASPIHLWPWLPVLSVAGLVAAGTLSARFGVLAMVPALGMLAVDLTAYSVRAPYTVPIELAPTLERWLGPADGGRVYSLCENRVGSNELLIAHRPTLNGPVGVTLLDYSNWRSMLLAAEWPSDRLHETSSVRRDLLDMANVTTVVACEPLDAPDLTFVSHVDPIYVYRNERAWPRAIWSCGAERLSRSEVDYQMREARYDERRQLVRRHRVNVRWIAGLPEGQRATIEARYRLLDGFPRGGTTWRYALADPSPDNVRALLRDTAVDDTHGIDRQTGTIVDAPPDERTFDGPAGDLLIGRVPCGAGADVTVQIADRPDGLVRAEVTAPDDGGFMFFSEPFYAERQAFVDGRPVEAQRAALGFTAVPVPPGHHVVELRLVPRTFYAGIATSVTTMVVWIGLAGAGSIRRSAGGRARRLDRARAGTGPSVPDASAPASAAPGDASSM